MSERNLPQSQKTCCEVEKTQVNNIIPAMSTPLASIFGSGFLVVVPILASAVGPYSIFAIVSVAFIAFLVGKIIRHNIHCAEPVLKKGDKRFTFFAERLSNVALVVAYIISICLYIHILASFVLSSFELKTAFNSSLLTSVVIASITAIGLMGGLKPLEKLEQIALYVTFAILALLLIMFAFYDINQFIAQGSFDLPEMPQRTVWEIATIVAGTLIVVQGFETPRYLGEQFNASTRIKASRWSQYISLSVYIIFVALALPIVSELDGKYDENSLIKIASTAALFLPLPLIIAASLSQFSAAVADTLAATANMREVTNQKLARRWGYLIVGAIAIALSWSGSTFEIIALASRAFAFYYLLQCLVAFSVCRNHKQRALFVFIGLILSFVLIFAVPAG